MVSTCEGTHELLQARFCFLQLNNTLIPDFPAHFSKSVLRKTDLENMMLLKVSPTISIQLQKMRKIGNFVRNREFPL